MGQSILLIYAETFPEPFTDSLHGVFVPHEQIRKQRILPEPLPPQASLMEKLYQSRLSHFVDVIFTRPQTREKSFSERIAFHIMFPLGWVVLIMAITDVAKGYFRASDMPGVLVLMSHTWRSWTPYLHRDDFISNLPIPQVRTIAGLSFPAI